MIKRSCDGCGVMMRVESLKPVACGPACSELLRRRAAANPGDPWYKPENPEQHAAHSRANKTRMYR